MIHLIQLTHGSFLGSNMATGNTGILKFFKPCSRPSRVSSRHPRLPKLFLIWMVRWTKGLQLKPNHRRLGYRKLYIYDLRVYCTFMKEFMSGHGLMCTIMVRLGAAILCSALQVVLIFWLTSIHQSFTPNPPLASGGLNFCLSSQVGDSPKFFRQCNIFADSPKFYATNVSHYTVYCTVVTTV